MIVVVDCFCVQIARWLDDVGGGGENDDRQSLSRTFIYFRLNATQPPTTHTAHGLEMPFDLLYIYSYYCRNS